MGFLAKIFPKKVLLSEKEKSDAEKQAQIDELARIAKDNEDKAKKEQLKAKRVTGIQKVRHDKSLEKLKHEHAKEIEKLKEIFEVKSKEHEEMQTAVKMLITKTVRQK